MRTIVLISCVSQKKDLRPDEVVDAKDLYVSPLFRKAYAYAKKINPDNIYILSARHGLLELDSQISTYNETLKNKSVQERKEWAEKILSSLRKKGFNLSTSENGGDKFILLAGKTYYQYLLGENGIGNYECPYLGCRGIGYILRFLSDKIGIVVKF